jgi:glycosyltransferase involved in cell wall biosynthesis
MTPSLSKFDNEESGIKRVVEAYTKYGPGYGLEFVEGDNFDLQSVHAGMTTEFFVNSPIVSHLHGLYWTADYPASLWEWKANHNVIESIRYATHVTVPSEWVSETLKRDMRLVPTVLPHGIEWDEWQHEREKQGYVLWNKNRDADVCSPEAVGELAKEFSGVRFVTTFAPANVSDNVSTVGLLDHVTMKALIQSAGIYLATTKETFGIGVLEAMASGIPVLGFAHGGNLELVKHGETGYLAKPGNYPDLCQGLEYCITHNKALGENGRERAKKWTWPAAVEQVAQVYQHAVSIFGDRKRPRQIERSLYLNE